MWPKAADSLQNLLGNQRLALVLNRRAAMIYSELGSWRRAAAIWLSLGEPAAAALSCQEAGAWRPAARHWLAAGEVEAARECYQRLLAASERTGTVEDEIAACLGLALCGRRGNEGRGEEAGEEFFSRAWRLLTGLDGRQPLRHGRCWELLGIYGRELGRDDLMQIGYQRALDILGSELASERRRVLRDFLAAAAGNRHLEAELESLAATWQLQEGGTTDAAV